MSRRAAAALTLGLVLACATPVATPPRSGPELLLPAELRDQGRAILAQTDENERGDQLRALQQKHGAGATADFLIAVLESDPSARVRDRIVGSLGNVRSSAATEALERRAASDPDVNVSLRALEVLHESTAKRLVKLLDTRMKAAPQDAKARARLQEAEDHWVTVAGGALLPSFLREPPPVFAAVPARRNVRVVAFGDYGSGNAEQREVAEALLRYHKQHRFDLGITLGDNFYPEGMHSPDDPRWATLWTQLYEQLGIRFFASLGNHDWSLADSPAAEVLFSGRTPSWQMPATRYTFTAGPAQFFAIDTDAISSAQLAWLDGALRASRARWKIVYGHHPIRSAGVHGDSPQLLEKLLPVLADRAQLYLAGHDHDMQHLTAERGVEFFVAGSGGAEVRPLEPGPRSRFASSSYGFAVLEIGPDALKVDLVGTDLSVRYSYTLTNPATAEGPGAASPEPAPARKRSTPPATSRGAKPRR